VLDLKEQGRRFSWSERDTMLYALAVEWVRIRLDRNELPFVYEKNLKALPTLAAVVAWGAGISAERLGPRPAPDSARRGSCHTPSPDPFVPEK